MGSVNSTGVRLSARDDAERKAKGSAQTAVTEAPQKPSAKPGSKGDAKAKKEKKEKQPKVDYKAPDGAAFVNAEGKFTASPEGYDSRKHVKLTKKDFAEEHVFFGWLADKAQHTADKLRKKAEESKKLGGLKEKGKAKKMLKAMAEYAKLEKELRGELGDDEVNKLMQQAMDSIKNAGAPEAAAS